MNVMQPTIASSSSNHLSQSTMTNSNLNKSASNLSSIIQINNEQLSADPPSKGYHQIRHDRQSSVQLKMQNVSNISGGNSFAIYPKASNWQRLKRALNYLISNLIILISQLSPIVQSFSGFIILLYLIQYGGDITIDFFALIPGEIISPGQWYHTAISLWTNSFLETNLIWIILDLLVLSFCGTLIEPLWGQKEVLRFMAISLIPTALLTSITYVLLYCCTLDGSYLFEVRIHGFFGFYAAMTVAVKQLLPQSILFSTAFGRLKNDHIAFTLTVVSIILYAFNVLTGVQIFLFIYGTIVSWLYLRFYQPHTRHVYHTSSDSINMMNVNIGNNNNNSTTITRGDLSDSFAFETFFPNVLRPLVAIPCNLIYNFLVNINICPRIPSPAAQLLMDNNDSMVNFGQKMRSSQSSSFNKFPHSIPSSAHHFKTPPHQFYKPVQQSQSSGSSLQPLLQENL